MTLLARVETLAAEQGAAFHVETYTACGERHAWASLIWPGVRDGMREVGRRVVSVEGTSAKDCAQKLLARLEEK